LSDNIGLRGPYVALSGQDSAWSVYTKINGGTIRRVVVITANAKTAKDPDWDTRQSPPGIVDVLGLVTTGPMGNYSFETVQLIAAMKRIDKDWTPPPAPIDPTVVAEACPR